jgi:hypothetical protein
MDAIEQAISDASVSLAGMRIVQATAIAALSARMAYTMSVKEIPEYGELDDETLGLICGSAFSLAFHQFLHAPPEGG